MMVKYAVAYEKLTGDKSDTIVISDKGYVAETKDDMQGLNPASKFLVVGLDSTADIVVTDSNDVMYGGELGEGTDISDIKDTIKCLPHGLYMAFPEDVWFDESMEDGVEIHITRKEEK